jgi:hypothetical protein
VVSGSMTAPPEWLPQLARARQERVNKWVQKTSRSPFLIDLIADDQRIDEVCGSLVADMQPVVSA